MDIIKWAITELMIGNMMLATTKKIAKMISLSFLLPTSSLSSTRYSTANVTMTLIGPAVVGSSRTNFENINSPATPVNQAMEYQATNAIILDGERLVTSIIANHKMAPATKNLTKNNISIP